MFTACSDSGGNRPDVVVRDSAGITIIENPHPDSTGVAWWRIESTPELDIGGINAVETHALFQVTDAARLSDGRIVVANAGTADVRYYSADGAHLSTSGRRGGGPGEFQRVSSIVPLPDDSLLVNDQSSRRSSILDPQGTFTRTLTSGSAAYPTISGRYSDGSLVGTFGVAFGAGPSQLESGLQRPDAAFVRMSPDGAVLDTIVVAPGTERILNINASGGSITSIQVSSVPFGKSTTHALYENRLYIGMQDAPEIVAYDTAGSRTHIIRTGASLQPVTDERLAAYIERSTANLESDVRQRVRDDLRAAPRARFLPAYGDIRTDVAGNLWIADYDDPLAPTGEWNVFDRDGRLVARIRLPGGLTVYEIGDDYVLGRERDELDTEHVVLYRLLKDAS